MLSIHYNGSNSFLFVNAVKMYQFKAKDSEMKPYPFCRGNISKKKKKITLSNMNKNELKESAEVFSVDHNPVDTSDILDIHKYLMKQL